MDLRKWIFNLHLVLGLTIGVLLVSAGLTGSVLVWRPELDVLLHRDLLRVEPAGEVLPLDRLVRIASQAYPDVPPVRVQMPRAPDHSAEITTGGDDPLEIYLDPYRGTVLGARGVDETFTNALFHWHTSLLSGETGERVMGVTALLLLLLVVSGVVVWWPGVTRFRAAVVVNWKANWKRVNYDIHRAAGFWGVLFLTVVAVTGSSLVFHDAYMAGLDWLTRSPRVRAPVVAATPAQPPLPLQEIVARAEVELPGGELTYVTIPQTATAPVVVRKKMAAEMHPNGRSFAYVHPATGEVLAVDDALNGPLGSRAYNVLYPIHIGRWGGLLSRVAHSVLGLLPIVLFVSGLLMWRNRTRKRPRVTRSETTPATTKVAA